MNEQEKPAEKTSDIVEKRKNKFKNWINDPYNLTLIGILIFATIVRLYFFNLTKNQPLWWDESDYMAYAKNLAGFNVDWIVTPQHNSLFPYLAALFFKIGFSEVVAKFFLVVLPSILLVFLTYKICTLMYNDKKIALVSTFLMATFWEILFNSMRFHIDNLALLLGFLAIYIFWQGYEKKEKIFGRLDQKFAIILTVFFVVLSYSIRRAYFIFGFFFLVYMLLTKKFGGLVKNKYNLSALFFAAILIFLAEELIFISPIAYVAGTYFHPEAPINLVPFQIFSAYFTNISNSLASILLYLFWIGIIIIGLNIFFSLGYLKKTENIEVKSDLFILLTILLTLSYFIFIQRNSTIGDPRWYYPLLFASFVCISRATLSISSYIKKYNKVLFIVVIVILIGSGGYYQLKHSNLIIRERLNSYSGIKEAGLFIKQVSSPNDIIVSVPVPQPAYYAERTVIEPWRFINKTSNTDTTIEEFVSRLQENEGVKYVIVSFSEPNHPEWMRIDDYLIHPQTGQPVLGRWRIPFMNTTIDFVNQQQDIKESVSYGNITFRLLAIKEDIFVYEVIRA